MVNLFYKVKTKENLRVFFSNDVGSTFCGCHADYDDIIYVDYEKTMGG